MTKSSVDASDAFILGKVRRYQDVVENKFSVWLAVLATDCNFLIVEFPRTKSFRPLIAVPSF